MKEFKVGERVRVFGWFADDWAKTIDGNIVDLDRDGAIVVSDGEDDDGYYCHPKQLRRLKPKRKARTVWVKFTANGGLDSVSTLGRVDSGYIEFREVRPKKGAR